MIEIRPRPVFDVKASDNVPESITKQKLMEKYVFFDEKDVNMYFYKQRTLKPTEFKNYKKNLSYINYQVSRALRKLDKRFKDESIVNRQLSKEDVCEITNGFVKIYRRDVFDNNVVPQSSNVPVKDPLDIVGSAEFDEYINDCVNNFILEFPNGDSDKNIFMKSFDTWKQEKKDKNEQIGLAECEHISKSYIEKFIRKDVKPESSFNPLKMFTDPLGFRQLSDQIPQVLEVIDQKLPDSEERTALLSELQNFTSKIPSFSMPSGGLGRESLEYAINVFDGIGSLNPTIIFVASVAWYAHDRTWKSWSFFMGSAIYFLIQVPDQAAFALSLYMKLSNHLPDVPDINMEEIVPHFSDSTLESVGTIIASALITLVLGKTCTSSSALLLAFVTNFSRARVGVIDIIKLIVSFVEKLVNIVRNNLFELPSIKFINSCSKELDDFSKTVQTYAFRHNRGTLPMNESTYSSIFCLLDVGKQILKTMPKDKFSEGSLRSIHEDCNILKKIIVEMERVDVSLRGIRQEPVGILFAGGPGVAKSIAMLYASHILAKTCLETEEDIAEFEQNPGPYIHSRKFENIYWDGLTNKMKVLVYDDLFQYRDGVGTASEAMEIIRALNTEEYNAHMAHLENKGNVFVRPYYGIGTTNQQNLVSNSIVSISAVKRRFDFYYVVVPKPEYVHLEDSYKDDWNRRMDKTKLPVSQIKGLDDPELAGEYVTDLRPEHLIYKRYDAVTDKYIDDYTFDQVIEEAQHLQFTKRKRFALHKENFRKMVRNYATVYDIKLDPEECPDDYSFEPDDEIEPHSGSPSVSSSSNSSDIPEFIDYFDCTPDQINEIEIKLAYNPEYMVWLINNRVPYKNCSSVSDVSAWLINTKGFYYARDYIETSYQYVDPYYRGKTHNFSSDKVRARKFTSIKQRIDYYLSQLPEWNRVKKYLIVGLEAILGIVSFILGCKFFLYFAKGVYSWWTGKPAPESFGYSDRMRAAKANAKYVRNSNAVREHLGVQPHSNHDPSGFDLIKSIVARNTFKFETKNDAGNWYTVCSITFVKGRIGITTYHTIVNFINIVMDSPEKGDRHVRLRHGSDSRTPDLLFTLKEVLIGHRDGILADNDFVLIEFPKRFPERPDITEYFVTDRDVEMNTKNLTIAMFATTRGNGEAFYFGTGRKYEMPIGIDKIPGYTYLINSMYTYNIPTRSGDCGSPVCLMNSRIQGRKILGFHVAGHTHDGDGFAGIVTRESLAEDLKLFAPQVHLEEPSFIEPQSADYDVPVRFEILGRTKLVPTRNIYTDIRKSGLHGLMGPSTLHPAMLAPTEIDGKLIDPILNAQQKYCLPDVLIDEDKIYECCAHYFAYCEWKSTFEVERRIYTTYEAIYGLEYDSDFGPINKTSSSGWPDCVLGVRDRFKELFGVESTVEQRSKAYNDISDRVDLIEDNARKNIRMFHPFVDNAKDELREYAKYLAGSTRMFSGCPKDFLVAWRKYFGAFSLWYMKNHIKNGSAIGMNPYSEWNDLAMKLIAVNPLNIGAGDYEKYDGSQKPIIHLIILIFINLWYNDGPENARIRGIYWMELYNSRHILNFMVYEWFSSLPSGHPFTIIVNTIYNHIIVRYSFLREVKSLESFNDNVYVITQGDDIAYAVSDDFKEFLNDIKLAVYAKELGMIYTNETKSGELIARRSLTEIEFLKRTFSFDKTTMMWICPLHIKSIQKMIDWTDRVDGDAITAQNVTTALRELSLHDKSLYNDVMYKISRRFNQRFPGIETSEPIEMQFESRRVLTLKTVAFY